MNPINEKLKELKKRGIDLGEPRGPEKDIGYGGRVRQYQKGNIYWHSTTGAHEVHGAILRAYLKQGGPGPNPATGKRQLGFPTSDEHRTHDGVFPKSEFEWGAITWVGKETGGGIIHGDIYDYWKLMSAKPILGHPISPQVKLADGEAAFFENGCIYMGPATGGKPVHCTLELPRIGQPHIDTPDKNFKLEKIVTWQHTARFSRQKTAIRRVLHKVWTGRLSLAPTGGKAEETIPLVIAKEHTVKIASREFTKWSLGVGRNAKLRDRLLYDISIVAPGQKPYIVAPHSIYTKKSWSNFGVMHTTDLHASRRLESFRDQLSTLAKRKRSLQAGVENYVNYNDGIRKLITEANRLYDSGEMDIIIATGDLIDYIFEDGDNLHGGGNWAFLEQLLRGQIKGPNGRRNPELRVPIFISAGNHDYRKHPYMLHFDIHVPILSDPEVKNFSPHNIIKAEADALQRGKPTISKEKAIRMAEVDKVNPYYFRRIVTNSSYIVRLGPHRITMIDSRWDAGILDNTWDAVKNELGFGSEDQRHFAAGNPNSEGFTKNDIQLVKTALQEGGGGGLVLVGVHAPPINTPGNEYPHFFQRIP